MTRFALVLAACVPCIALGADDPKMPDPKMPATELEGVWQEPLRPGEDPAVRFRVTFTGDKVTINIDGQVLKGTFWTEDGLWVTSAPARKRDRVPILVTITEIEGNGTFEKGSYSGLHSLEKDQLMLSFGVRPTPIVETSTALRVKALRDQRPTGMELAPYTLTLAKVKK
jgi:hypothetical protein